MNGPRPVPARACSLALPLLLVLGAAAPALAAKPVRTPAPALTTKPANPSSSALAGFGWTAAAGTSYTCSLDGARASACTAPRSYSGLKDGSHAFTLRAAAATGGSKVGVTSYSWKVDTIAPPAPVIAAVPSPTRATSVSVSFTDAESTATFRCALDGAAAVACTSPFSATGLTEGVHALVVAAGDAAGNSTPATVGWTVDHTAPNVPVVVSPASPTRSTSVQVAFSDSDATTFSCSLDGAPGQPCTSPKTVSAPAEGPHTLSVTPYDAAGNSGAPAAATWVLDLTSPAAPTLVTGPAALTNQTTATLLFTDADTSAATFTCAVDGAVAAPCSSPFAVSGLHEGTRTVTVTAADAAGNTSPALSTTWVVDLTAPTPALLTAGPDSPSSDQTPTFAIESTDASAYGFTCSLDGAAAYACDSGEQPSVTVDGPHALDVRALDAASNASSPVRWSWVLDTTPPPAPLLTGPAALVNLSTASLTFTSAEADAGFQCSLDGADASACSSPLSLVGLADGPHTVTVAAVDRAGNSTTSATSWTVDTVAPGAAVVTGPSAPTAATTVDVTFSAVGAAGFTCSVDGAATSGCTSPSTLPAGGEGEHVLTVVPRDAAGNLGPAGAATWTVDRTAPAAPVLPGPGTATSSGDVTIPLPDPPAGTTHTCSLDGAAATVCGNPATYTGLAPGTHTVEVVDVDAAGNAGPPTTVTVEVPAADAAPPVVIGDGAPNSGTPAPTPPVLTLGSSDPAVTGYLCSVDGGPFVPCATGFQPSGTGEGTHTVDVVATYGDGTQSAPVGYGYTIDTTPPAAPVVPPPPATATGAVVVTPTPVSGVTFLCSLDGAPATPCAVPVSLTGLPDGPHTLVVSAVDAAGNVSPGTSLGWTVDTTAPTAVATVPTTLTGATTLLFSEDVHGLSSASVALAIVGGPAVPVSLTCRTAAAAVTPCTGTVRSVALTPTLPLVPGQRYTATLTAAVQDAAGNSALLAPTVFRAALTQQETSPALVQAWRVGGSAAALGSRYGVAELAGASASYAFTGTSVAWYTATGPTMGTAKVYVDNVLKGTVNDYAAAAHWRVLRALPRLTAGPHVLKIVATGLRGSTAGRGTQVVVDAVRVGATVVVNPALRTTWGTVALRTASGGGYAVADLATDAVSMTFRGTRLTLWTATGRTMGRARVYIDGVLKTTLDNYSTATFALRRLAWGLTDKVHTVKVVALGTHRAGATGNRVVVDALVVG